MHPLQCSGDLEQSWGVPVRPEPQRTSKPGTEKEVEACYKQMSCVLGK